MDRLVVTMPTPDGKVNPLTLAACAVAGVDEVYRVGGAQAVGMLAYGTQTVKAVDKIVGPGNAYVASAKRQVFGIVGIDMIAGPSEVTVVSDAQTDPAWIAADLLAQAVQPSDFLAYVDGDVLLLPENVAEDARRIRRAAYCRAAIDAARGVASAAYSGDAERAASLLTLASRQGVGLADCQLSPLPGCSGRGAPAGVPEGILRRAEGEKESARQV